jgi:hypothetical protein
MMQFTFNGNNQNNLSQMYFGKTQRQSLNQLTKSVPVVKDVSPSAQKEEKKMTWGEPIWFLFHTLAQKVKDESFHIVRSDLLNNIYAICSNLPCPVCTNHAIEYLNKTNFNNIRTKDDLIKMLFIFHNEVNKRKSMEAFNYEDVEGKYSSAITMRILQNFFLNYDVKSKNMRLLANDFHKKKLIANLKVWLTSNLQYFDS